MLRAFWTWDPVGGAYPSPQPSPARGEGADGGKWFFDKSAWQRVFRAMSGCGFNAIVLANTNPFPFMIDLAAYPQAQVVTGEALADCERMHKWVFETALDYEIAPYLCFHAGGESGVEYPRHCVRMLLEEYPELAGLLVDVDDGANQAQLVQQAVIETLDAIRPDAPLYVRTQCGPTGLVDSLKRRGGRTVRYSIKYTGDHLVDAGPDSHFTRWIEAVGAPNVAAEFRAANFEPWTCFSYDTIEQILENLRDIGCEGFSVHPLSMSDWPRTSDTFFKYQCQRDLVWYSAWGGSGVRQLLGSGQPKWLLRNQKLVDGFQAGSRVLELLGLYVAGDRTDRWRPQFCCIGSPDGTSTHLLTISDMLSIETLPEFGGRNWWEEVTGDRVVRLADYVKSGTPEGDYGPDELIEELADLSEQAVAAGEKGMRNASGEQELPALARDAFCMGLLGEFYVERFRAALAHARGEESEALEHMSRAVGLYRDIRGVDSTHRRPFRFLMGRSPVIGDWTATIKALEAELADASRGVFPKGADCPVRFAE